MQLKQTCICLKQKQRCMLGITEPNSRFDTLIDDNTSFFNYIQMKILMHDGFNF